MKNTFVEFNERFFGHTSLPIKWYDETGIIQLPDEMNDPFNLLDDEDKKCSRLVKITLSGSSGGQYYDWYDVEIINKHQGRIERKMFAFDNYMTPTQINQWGTGITANIQNTKLDWFSENQTPKSTTPMVEAIFSYIKQFI